ncbi:unnamed protein product [Orchesella dallaii]|uniref:Cytochrome P450 n=1 Tax=Orchesella dallaii TaxID=48710 RepID=A0ABP1Q520_9HEXA
MWLALILVAVTSCLIYYFARFPKKVWKKYGVYQVKPPGYKDMLSVIVGTKSMMDTDSVMYKQLEEDGQKYGGFMDMSVPALIVRDLDIMKKIMIKDFDHFVDRRPFFSSKHEPILQKTLVSLLGDEWKGVRTAVSPTFTTGKIRRMMELFNRVSNEWVKHFNEEIKKSSSKDSVEINAQKETIHLTVENIASTVFGMEAGAIHDPNSAFAKNAHKISELSIFKIIKFSIAFQFPWLVDFLGFEIIDRKGLNFFEQIMSQGLKARMSGEVKRNDFLQLLAEARKGELKAEGGDELNTFEKEALLNNDASVTKKNYLQDDDIAHAQLIGFFFAGFSTTANIIAVAAYALAVHQDIQDKLRKEVDSKLFKDGKDQTEVDYDELNKLVYLDMFLSEVLRKWPPLGRLERKCVKEYHDPESGLRVPKDALIIIPLSSIHDDPKFYEHPDKFYPEHFTAERKAERNPYAYLPFGTGPRNCIGMRFALVQTKSAIAHLVHNFRIETSSKTPIPILAKKVGFGIQVPENLQLKLSSIQK